MKVRFIASVQQELYRRNVHGALDAWTVHGKTECGKLVLIAPCAPAYKKRRTSLFLRRHIAVSSPRGSSRSVHNRVLLTVAPALVTHAGV